MFDDIGHWPMNGAMNDDNVDDEWCNGPRLDGRGRL